MVHTEDRGTAVSATGSIVTQPTTDEALSIAETKVNDTESFYFVNDDKLTSESVEAVSVLAEVAGDTEPEVEQQQQDEEMEEETETAAEAALTEAPSPVPQTQPSSSDPNSLLTSVRLVIGLLSQYCFMSDIC